MPGAPVDVVVTVEGIGEGAVGSTALRRRCAVVDGGPDQWVTKAHCGSERHETGCFDAGDRFLPWRSQQPRCPVKERRIAQSFRRREQQDGPTRRWQQTGAGGELILERKADRNGLGERCVSPQLLGGQLGDNLGQRERVSLRLLDQAIGDLGVDRAAGDGRQQGSSVVLRQSEDHELGQRIEQVGETLPGVTHGEQHRDRIRVQPAGDERQHTRRLVVEPLRIVDDEKYRSFTRRVVEEREHREEHHQGARRSAIGETEHRLQRVALRVGQLDHVVQERHHELVDRGEAEADLGLDAGDARDGEVARVGHRVVEQGGFADPRRAPHDDDAARAVACIRQDLVDGGALSRSTYQHRAEPSPARSPNDGECRRPTGAGARQRAA